MEKLMLGYLSDFGPLTRVCLFLGALEAGGITAYLLTAVSR